MAAQQLPKPHSSISPSKLILKVQEFCKGCLPNHKVAGNTKFLFRTELLPLISGRWIRLAGCVVFCVLTVHLENSCKRTPVRPGIHLDQGTAEILGSADIAFAMDCMRHGVGAIEQGKLAHRLATDPAVKNLATELVEEYARANAQLQAIVAAKKIHLAELTAAEDESADLKLAKRSGAKFDYDYVAQTWKREKSQVKLYRKEIKSGNDSAVKAFAAGRLPDLSSAIEKLKALRMKLHGK